MGSTERGNEKTEGGVKTKYIVYAHHTVLIETVIRAYSPAEAEYRVKKQMIKRGDFEPGVDKVMNEKEEQIINANSKNPCTR